MTEEERKKGEEERKGEEEVAERETRLTKEYLKTEGEEEKKEQLMPDWTTG